MTNIRGIEHIGITVPDIGVGERFFEQAFGAETLYALIDRDGPSQSGDEMHARNGLAIGSDIVAMRMMRLGGGPNVELFEVDRTGRAKAAIVNDIGLHHFAIYVDDLAEAADRFCQAGGTMMEGPITLGGKERGNGNQCWFGRAPWGMMVELIHLPSPLALDDEQRSGPRWLPCV